jgi:hypothetical protein
MCSIVGPVGSRESDESPEVHLQSSNASFQHGGRGIRRSRVGRRSSPIAGGPSPSGLRTDCWAATVHLGTLEARPRVPRGTSLHGEPRLPNRDITQLLLRNKHASNIAVPRTTPGITRTKS